MEDTFVPDAAGSIVVDTNPGEAELFERLHAKMPSGIVTRGRLDVGDVLVTCADGTRLIIERKQLMDLVASLGDGRAANQKARQLSAAADDESGKTMVVYIVQGELPNWHALLQPRGFPASQVGGRAAPRPPCQFPEVMLCKHWGGMGDGGS